MINFSEVEKSVRLLKKQLADGKIDQKTFEDCLIEMIDIAEDGYYWMFGHESERWFRHDGKKWVADDPGEIWLSFPQNNMTPTHTSSPHSSFTRNPEWQSVNWGWLITSIIVMTIIAGVVYNSSLVY